MRSSPLIPRSTSPIGFLETDLHWNMTGKIPSVVANFMSDLFIYIFMMILRKSVFRIRRNPTWDPSMELVDLGTLIMTWFHAFPPSHVQLPPAL